METVGDRIRSARQEKGLTMDQLAKAIGKKESYISELERGGIKRGSQLAWIATVLGVSLNWLETGTGLRHDTLGDSYMKSPLFGDRYRLGVAEGTSNTNVLAGWLAASPETKAAVELLCLPAEERAALVAGNASLVAGIELLETHAIEALRHRKSA